jgi:hypothetical protein
MNDMPDRITVNGENYIKESQVKGFRKFHKGDTVIVKGIVQDDGHYDIATHRYEYLVRVQCNDIGLLHVLLSAEHLLELYTGDK